MIWEINTTRADGEGGGTIRKGADATGEDKVGGRKDQEDGREDNP